MTKETQNNILNDMVPFREFERQLFKADTLKKELQEIIAELASFVPRAKAAKEMPRSQEKIAAWEQLNPEWESLQIRYKSVLEDMYFEADIAMKLLETNYTATKNALYVWVAIAASKHLQGGQMPAWCVRYLQESALNIFSILTNGEKIADPQGCNSEALQILGFARPGWNAFSNLREIGRTAKVYKEFKELQKVGSKTQTALANIGLRHGIENERSLRRKFAALRRAFDANAATDVGQGETTD